MSFVGQNFIKKKLFVKTSPIYVFGGITIKFPEINSPSELFAKIGL